MSSKKKTFSAKINGKTFVCECGCKNLTKNNDRLQCNDCKDIVIGRQFEIPAPIGFGSLERPKYVATLADAKEWEMDETGEYVWDIIGVFCTDKLIGDIQEEYEELLLENAQIS